MAVQCSSQVGCWKSKTSAELCEGLTFDQHDARPANKEIIRGSPVSGDANKEIAINCKNLSKSFGAGTVRALNDVSLAIRPNEFFTLLGSSGCGKTTLLRLIAGFEIQNTGSIAVYGESLDGRPPHKRPVNTVFQSYAMFPHMTVAENIAFGLEMKRLAKGLIKDRVAEMLALVRLDGLGERRPHQLSGGQQQRVALARALATAPKVLLLDEPLSALDLKLRTEMQVELKRLQSEVGITFVFVTHDQHEALAMSDRMAVMSAGHILQVGTPNDIYETPANRFVADFIGETNLLSATRSGADRIRLADGTEINVGPGLIDGKSLVLGIRPERMELCETNQGTLNATVETIAYLGTDTVYHLNNERLGHLQVRIQNRGGTRTNLSRGEIVGIRIPANAVRVFAE